MSELVVEITGLLVRYGACEAVRGLDLEVRGGEVFGLLGPNGAGKTTTLRVLIGQTPASAGLVKILGKELAPGREDIKPALGYVPERENHFEEFSGRRNLDFFAGLYGVSPARVVECLRRVELDDAADAAVRTYSLGMRRRLLLARALLHEPRLLILDEPTANLDAHGCKIVCEILRKHAEAGNAVLLTTHDMEHVETLCDRVGILSRGRLLAVETPAALRQQHSASRVDVRLNDGSRHIYDMVQPDQRQSLAYHVQQGTVATMETRPLDFRQVYLDMIEQEIVST